MGACGTCGERAVAVLEMPHRPCREGDRHKTAVPVPLALSWVSAPRCWAVILENLAGTETWSGLGALLKSPSDATCDSVTCQSWNCVWLLYKSTSASAHRGNNSDSFQNYTNVKEVSAQSSRARLQSAHITNRKKNQMKGSPAASQLPAAVLVCGPS